MEIVKRSKPKKYVPTPAIDAGITRIYREAYDKKQLRTLPTLRVFAQRIGWPHWAVKVRGRQLGLARTKEAPWSEKELELLARHSWMTPEVLWRKFREHGYQRTVTAIHLKMKRVGYKQCGDFYSATSLQKALGLDSHVITRWVRLGWLIGTRRGTARTEVQGGDTWLFLEDDVRKFLIEHPDEYALRKVDQRWFLYIITKGEVAA